MPMTTYTIDEFREHVSAGKDYDPSETMVVAPVERVESSSDANRTVTFKITSGGVDRANDVINPKGWDLRRYKSNPVVLYGHSHADLPIARTINLQKTKEGLTATAQFVPEDTPVVGQRAEAIRQLIKGRFLSTASVGFRPLKVAFNSERGGMDFDKQELLEWSVVAVPMNADAVVEQRSAAEAEGIQLDAFGGDWPAPFLSIDDTSEHDTRRSVLASITDEEFEALRIAREADDQDEVIIDEAPADQAPVQRAAEPSVMDAIATLTTTIDRLIAARETHTPDQVWFELDTSDTEPVLEFSPDDLDAAIVPILEESLRTAAVTATRAAVRHAQGRID